MSALRTLLALVAFPVGLVLVLPILVVGVPFWLMSGLVSSARWLFRKLQPEAVPWTDVIEFDEQVGWKPRPGLDVHVEAERPFRLTTDEEGWRGPGSIDVADALVFGDSFAFGHGADEGQVFTDLSPGIKLKAVGMNGYAQVQQLLLMERIEPRINADLVVWFIFYGNDLLENLKPNLGRLRMPFVREADAGEGWEIVTSHVSPQPWPMRNSVREYGHRLSEICSGTYLSERVFSACRFLLRRGKEVCDRAGARLAVFGIPEVFMMRPHGEEWLARMAPDPERFDPKYPDRRLRESCDELGIRFVSLMERLDQGHYKPDDPDGHWNRRGHREVGELIARIHEDIRYASVHTRARRDQPWDAAIR